jgi:hypothetical protein
VHIHPGQNDRIVRRDFVQVPGMLNGGRYPLPDLIEIRDAKEGDLFTAKGILQEVDMGVNKTGQYKMAGSVEM